MEGEFKATEREKERVVLCMAYAQLQGISHDLEEERGTRHESMSFH